GRRSVLACAGSPPSAPAPLHGRSPAPPAPGSSAQPALPYPAQPRGLAPSGACGVRRSALSFSISGSTFRNERRGIITPPLHDYAETGGLRLARIINLRKDAECARTRVHYRRILGRCIHDPSLNVLDRTIGVADFLRV